MTDDKEVLIKCKTRVQNHGEVFTPKFMVEKMLNRPGIKEACGNLESTFLEPSVGEGAFLIVILSRKLDMVSKLYNESLQQYENYSLLALSTLYGVELLEDNTKKCVLNLYQVYLDYYDRSCQNHGMKPRNSDVLSSAKTIISANIRQGDFLTQLSSNGEPIIFSEWKQLGKFSKKKFIQIIRTEYTLDEIQRGEDKSPGETVKKKWIASPVQLDLFSPPSNIEVDEEPLRYLPCSITEIHKEIMGY